jgi:hypothetical protein
MLPGPYERWFTELSGRPAPVETRATCDACAMLPGAPDLPPEGPFDPALRCCTYHPHLAPHLVGGILAHGTDGGRARVRARIAARVGVTPLGVAPPPAYTRAHGVFGRSREKLCPFYEDARCTIWSHRGIACAGFHCKLDRGALGQSLWNLLVVGFTVVERALARWLLARQGVDAAACDVLLRAPEDAALDARAWGAWHGREADYFVAAAQLIEPLSWDEVVALGGPDVARVAEAVRETVVRLDALPERVRRNDQILHHPGRAGRVRLQSWTVPLDLLEVSTAVADRIRALDETRLSELDFDGALVRRLLDWGALLPAG